LPDEYLIVYLDPRLIIIQLNINHLIFAVSIQYSYDMRTSDIQIIANPLADLDPHMWSTSVGMIVDEIADELRLMILSSQFKPGEFLEP